jgi:hypothetical protein
VACGGGFLYLVADDGRDVHFYRAGDLEGLSFEYLGKLDRVERRTARDPYIAARGKYVVVGWKEHNDTRWSQVIAFSRDNGATWTRYYDGMQTSYDNYEPHLAIAGGKVHAAYVSNYPGRNEVYYKRFDLSGNMEGVFCVSDASDGASATQPCIMAEAADRVNVYYVHGDSAPHPIYESYTVDGVGWGIVADIIPTGGGTDMSWPEVISWNDGGDLRKVVACDGRNLGDGNHGVFARRYYLGMWDEDTSYNLVLCADSPTYPQLAARGTDLLCAYRQTGASAGDNGAAQLNGSHGESTGWNPIYRLFYSNLPYGRPGSIDCCSDGSRFYTAQAGTGEHARVLVKREDTRDPRVTLVHPGSCHREDFRLQAEACDDFDHDAPWSLSPGGEGYESGILHADFYYRPSGSEAWIEWPGGSRDGTAPWSRTFPASSAEQGRYDFRVVVTDTALRVSEDRVTGVWVDRDPPRARLVISPPDGDDGWYTAPPESGPEVRGEDDGSGVARAYWRLDDAASWNVYCEPFGLPEGVHRVHYYVEDRAGNVSPVQVFPYRADYGDPRGEILSPSPGRYFRATLAAKVSCYDEISGVDEVTWLVDGAPVASGSCDETVLDLAGLVDGQHVLQVEVRDRAGRSSVTDPLLFYKDVTPPVVEVVEPRGDKWVRGMAVIKADVTDNLKVGRVAFYVDGEEIDRRTSPPWTASWDTSTVPNGYHVVTVRAWDAAGNTAEVGASGEVSVFVGNNISETNHFAEGCTREGFDTWLCLQNPGEERADVTVNYYLGEGQGAASTRTYSLPPHSRSTIYVNSDVGAGKDVSIQVTSSRPIVSERPVYFQYAGEDGRPWKGGHTAQGAHFPRREWYFAEGCTREGFDTWLCLQNPREEAADVRVDYFLEDGGVLSRHYRVAPWSRGTVKVDCEVGEGHDVAMKVSSSHPVVAERPVYFLYRGMWDGGHNVMGARRPEREWYFAEGCTRTGFNQWLCLLNPGEDVAEAAVTYLTEDGGTVEKLYRLAPHSRFTVNVNDDVARQHDVSTRIASDRPLVVERPMYFLYQSTIDEGSNAMGAVKPGSSWYLAEGCTRPGFDEWICLMNPGEEEAEVLLRFMLEDGTEREHRVKVPGGTRVTVKVNDVVGVGHDVSTEVTSDVPVIVERPMYSLYRGTCPSADTLSGYTFNP